MKTTREILEGPTGKVLAVALVVVAGVAAYLSFRSDGTSAVDASRERTFVDAESGKAFQASVGEGTTVPMTSPFTGKKTGVEAELCYWTGEGTPKKTPDAVLLNSRAMPPRSEPTFCPVCHRLVVARNPTPFVDSRPPPTEQEYAARQSEQAH